MIWSPTPAVRRRLAVSATAVLPSAIKAASARAMRFISWPNTDPAHSLPTLSPERYRPGPKTRYQASGAELPRWSFHPLEIMSFSCRTKICTTSERNDKPVERCVTSLLVAFTLPVRAPRPFEKPFAAPLGAAPSLLGRGKGLRVVLGSLFQSAFRT